MGMHMSVLRESMGIGVLRVEYGYGCPQGRV